MKLSFLTLGCKVNQAEALEWEKEAAQQGHQVVSLEGGPDICVVNTCTVTGKSDYESRRLIRRAQKAGAKVLVTGCYAQLNTVSVEKMAGVTSVVENTKKDYIIRTLSRDMPSSTGINASLLTNENGTRTRKFLKIQDGCEYSCSYCLVWKARGISRSVSPERVVDQVKEAVDSGYREIVLTGVHLGLYGKDLEQKLPLSSLINDIISNSSAQNIRLSSLEVNEIDEGLLDMIKEGYVLPHLHVPLQSGDTDVLTTMRRNYTREFFRERILQIREKVGDVALGTDIIAGFPSESDESFKNTMTLVKELPFTYLHVFPYSPRPGTRASEIPDIVGDAEKKSRASILRKVSSEKKNSYMKAQIGKTLSVLVEKVHDDGNCLGTSGNYLKVSAPLPPEAKGNIVQIRIEKAAGDRLTGNLIE